MTALIFRSYLSTARLSGLTFIEVLITLAFVLMSILLNSQSIHAVVTRQQANSLLEQLQNGLTFARTNAIYSSNVVTVCPLNDTQCGLEWHRGLLIFIDSNNNKKKDQTETLLRVVNFDQQNFSMTWTASGRKKFLRFSPSGNAKEFGRFNLCSRHNYTVMAQTLVVSRMGKTRRYRDRDRDGSVEDFDGRQPDC